MEEGLKQKLLSRIIEAEGPLDTPCWLWTGGTTSRGYGAVWWNSQHSWSSLITSNAIISHSSINYNPVGDQL